MNLEGKKCWKRGKEEMRERNHAWLEREKAETNKEKNKEKHINPTNLLIN